MEYGLKALPIPFGLLTAIPMYSAVPSTLAPQQVTVSMLKSGSRACTSGFWSEAMLVGWFVSSVNPAANIRGAMGAVPKARVLAYAC